jgi:hypothetical protein
VAIICRLPHLAVPGGVNKAGGTDRKSIVSGITPYLLAKRIPPHHPDKPNAVTADLH